MRNDDNDNGPYDFVTTVIIIIRSNSSNYNLNLTPSLFIQSTVTENIQMSRN